MSEAATGLPPPPPAPAAQPAGTRLRIAISGWSRTVALTKAVVAVLLAIGFIVSAVKARDVPRLSEDEATARLVTSIVFAALSAWAAWIFAIPGLARNAFIELSSDALLVRHPGVFKHPLTVPRDEIKAAAIDPRPWRWRWLGNKGRFHLGDAEVGGQADGGAPPAPGAAARGPFPEWLFSVVGGSPFPVLSNVDDVPNVALLFSAPIRLRAVRRSLRPFATKNPVHIPLQARQVRGILVRMKNIDEAAGALAAWTSVRPLTHADVTEIEPDAAYTKRAKKRHRVANIWLTILLLVQFGIPAVLSLADHSEGSSPSHEATL